MATALPVSDEFYNWRDFSSGNVTKIKNMMQHFYEFVKSASFEEYIPNSTYSLDQWSRYQESKELKLWLSYIKMHQRSYQFILTDLCQR